MILLDKIEVSYDEIQDYCFKENLQMIDSYMPELFLKIAKVMITENTSKIESIIEIVEQENPFNYINKNAYRYKLKKLLRAFALGMTYYKPWDGKEDYTLIPRILKQCKVNSDFNPFEIDSFEDYLLSHSSVIITITDLPCKCNHFTANILLTP